MPVSVSSKGKAKLPNVRASVEPSATSSYFGKPLSSYLKKADVTVEEILDNGASSSQIPSGTKLISMRDHIEKTMLKAVESRSTQSEGALRELISLKKNRVPREREKDKDGDDRERKHKLKKVSKKHDEDGKHPPAVGAHGVARQDGGDAKGKSPPRSSLLLFHLCTIVYTGNYPYCCHAKPFNHASETQIPGRQAQAQRTEQAAYFAHRKLVS
jgi:transcriptional adapter 3